jgi:hypothetical protein
MRIRGMGASLAHYDQTRRSLPLSHKGLEPADHLPLGIQLRSCPMSPKNHGEPRQNR